MPFLSELTKFCFFSMLSSLFQWARLLRNCEDSNGWKYLQQEFSLSDIADMILCWHQTKLLEEEEKDNFDFLLKNIENKREKLEKSMRYKHTCWMSLFILCVV